MASLTHKNHFKFGYNGVPTSFRKSVDDQWFTSYGRAERHHWTFRDESKYTARLIRESTHKPIYVCLSGGNDSEVVANAFLSQNIPITPLIAVYTGGANEYDTNNAVAWCKFRGLEPEFLHIDVLDYWVSNEALDLAKTVSSISPQFLVYMKIIQHVKDIGGFPVMGSAECYLENNDLPPHMFEREKVASMYRYCEMQDIDSAIGFFQYTPEIMLSYLLDPLVVSQVEGKTFKNSKEFKFAFYRQHFDVNYREPTSGFERIWKEDKLLRDQLYQIMPTSDSVSKHDYWKLVESLQAKS